MTATKLAINGGSPVRTTPFPSWPIFDHTDEAALSGTLRSGSWYLSDRVEHFERSFAAYQDARFGIATTSGTTALQTALSAVGAKLGDEVIVPSYTFIATASSVAAVGCVPVFVDVDANTYNIDPRCVEEAITERTRAVIAVHVGGQPANLDALSEIAQRRGVSLIEDACQAHGAAWKGRKVGAIGDLGCFSFQASKNLNAGEGGFITTDDPGLADLAWSLHNCGRVKDGKNRYEIRRLGGNCRLNEFQAAILSNQLTRLDAQTTRRTSNAELLTSLIGEIRGVEPQQRDTGVSAHAYHLYILRFRSDEFEGLSRQQFIAAVKSEGIPCSPGYKPLYREPAFAHTFADYPLETPYFQGVPDYSCFNCPVTERICAEEAVWFTQNMLLGEEEDVRDIAEAIARIRERVGELL